MRTVQIDLPDKVAEGIDALVSSGWFRDADELVTFALLEFIRGNPLDLAEQFQRDDIAWALQQKMTSK